MQNWIYIALIGILLAIFSKFLHDSYPVQTKKIKYLFVTIKLSILFFIRFYLRVTLVILDYIHLIILLAGTIIFGLVFFKLHEVSSDISDYKVIVLSPLSFISEHDWYLLWSYRVFEVSAGLVFFFSLSLLFISIKLTTNLKLISIDEFKLPSKEELK